jgi:hypothetical protein
MQRLHYRTFGNATLLWSGCEPWKDDKGGIGFSVLFKIVDDLAEETRAAQPLMEFANGQCTITGSGNAGEVIYYTVDGTLPYPPDDDVPDGGPNSSAFVYGGAFAVDSGTVVRAICTEPEKEQGDVREKTAP